ncbi:sulfotransferase family protein [Roseinatronobacter thiooxidans]|uniref:Sulfotransferase family protein n=1 Tax=Roseinatronobacter thiooxidans TaxID=121821 RepID=A0A2W7Q7L8_9RHOB|nr:sulfotransferase [Roseinatronobacter thiooxidans]PZX44564.1 sulfotransferase family protein [Roseinatronobacter thiooxidans]
MQISQIKAALEQAQKHAAQGEFDAARALCLRVFAHDPGVIGALQTYMSVTRVTPDDPVLLRLRAFARSKAQMPPMLASQVQFMLGKGLDDIGDHTAAFAAFLRANALKPVQFDADAQARLVKATLQAVAEAPQMQLAPTGPRMVFIIGMPRSGSSVLAQVLGQHPDIQSVGEMTALGRALHAIEPNLPRFIQTMTPDRLSALRKAYLAEVVPLAPNAPVIVDKMPENYWLGWLIPMIFPDALVLETRRAPLAVCWSCFRNDFGQGHAYSTDFPTLWAHYHRYKAMTDAWRARAGAQWHVIELDALAKAPHIPLAPCLAQLGLSWTDAMARPQDATSDLRTLSKWQARQSLTPRIAAAWMNYRPMILDKWGRSLVPSPKGQD